jgi:uncharacterized protein YjbI with pentapeptide repeats
LLGDHGYTIFEDGPIIGSNLDRKFGWVEVRETIGNFFNKAKPSQKLLFYFSGHGIVSGDDVYLGTPQVDHSNPWTHGFSLSDLTKQMSKSKSTQIVAIIDACYSGAADLPSSMKRKKAAKDNVDRSLATYDKVWKNKNTSKSKAIYLLLSSQSYESSNALEGSNSLYTRHLLEGLRGFEPTTVDENGNVIDYSGSIEDNGEVTPNSLHNYVYHKVANITDQVPIIKSVESKRFAIVNYPKLARRPQTSQKDYLLQLLTEGKIDKFNEIRKKDNYSQVEFYNVDLGGRDLSYTDLRNSDLNLANLREAKLHQVVFVEATVKGAHLEGADLSKANLSGANLSGANLTTTNLSGANLTTTNLSGANLSNANLSGANLTTTNLSGANLTTTNLRIANLSAADLQKANLSWANLSEADLSNANLCIANLSNANLSNANLSMVDLSDAILSGAHLSNANLSWTDLSEANLSNANLSNANLSNANLSNANLSHADLYRVNLSGANLTTTNLSGANLASSTIIGVKFIDEEEYPLCKDANFDNATIIDDEQLYRHFRNNNSNPRSIPPAVKDKKELREKLEQRGFGKETIDTYLIFPSLAK